MLTIKPLASCQKIKPQHHVNIMSIIVTVSNQRLCQTEGNRDKQSFLPNVFHCSKQYL